MRRAMGLAILMILNLLGGGRGDESAAKAGLPVEQLIQRLGDRDYHVRRAAYQALAGRGVEILPALQKARKDQDDAEVARHLDALIPALERAALLLPKRVNLRLTKRPLHEALAELTRQTGHKIELGNGGVKDQVFSFQTRSFQIEGATFWEALDQVAETAGLVLSPNAGQSTIRLEFNNQRVPFLHRDGIFRVVAQRFDYSKMADFSAVPRRAMPQEQGGEFLNCTLSIAVEPRLPLLELGETKLIEACDDQKRSLIPASGHDDGVVMAMGMVMMGQTFSAPNNNDFTYVMQTQVALAGPSARAQRVKRLKGTIPVTLLVEQKPQVVIDQFLSAKGKSFKVGGTDLTLQNAEELGKDSRYRVQLTVQDVGNKGGVGYWYQSFPQRVELQDAKGNKYDRGSASWGNDGGNGLNGDFQFQKPSAGKVGPAVKLVYYTMVTVTQNVTFEFKDLPLP